MNTYMSWIFVESCYHFNHKDNNSFIPGLGHDVNILILYAKHNKLNAYHSQAATTMFELKQF